MLRTLKTNDIAMVFETNDILNFINLEISNNFLLKDETLLTLKNFHIDILKYCFYSILQDDLGYLISSNLFIPDEKLSFLIKVIKDKLYKNIINFIKLDINLSYVLNIMVINDNTHLIFTYWSNDVK